MEEETAWLNKASRGDFAQEQTDPEKFKTTFWEHGDSISVIKRSKLGRIKRLRKKLVSWIKNYEDVDFLRTIEKYDLTGFYRYPSKETTQRFLIEVILCRLIICMDKYSTKRVPIPKSDNPYLMFG